MKREACGSQAFVEGRWPTVDTEDRDNIMVSGASKRRPGHLKESLRSPACLPHLGSDNRPSQGIEATQRDRTPLPFNLLMGNALKVLCSSWNESIVTAVAIRVGGL